MLLPRRSKSFPLAYGIFELEHLEAGALDPSLLLWKGYEECNFKERVAHVRGQVCTRHSEAPLLATTTTSTKTHRCAFDMYTNDCNLLRQTERLS